MDLVSGTDLFALADDGGAGVMDVGEDHAGAAEDFVLQFVTPGQRHRGEDRALLDQRRQLYEAARARHPERWSGAIRQWEPVSTVCLNPGRLPNQEANKTSNAT